MSGRWLLLVLAVVLLMLAARLKTDRPEPPVQPAVQPAGERADWLAHDTTPRDDAPARVSRPALETALRDPFRAIAAALPVTHGPQPPSIAAVAAPALPPAPPPSVPPLPPAPPAPGLAFAGRMVTPDGRTVVMASLGNDTLTLRTGQQLPNGFRVDAIDADEVLLSHPALAQPARLAIPPAPRLQTR